MTAVAMTAVVMTLTSDLSLSNEASDTHAHSTVSGAE